MPAYSVEWDVPALRELLKLDPQIARRVALAVTRLAADPFPAASTAPVGSPAGTRRLRVGDFRVVYVVETDRLVVTIARVRHRRDVYRDR